MDQAEPYCDILASSTGSNARQSAEYFTCSALITHFQGTGNEIKISKTLVFYPLFPSETITTYAAMSACLCQSARDPCKPCNLSHGHLISDIGGDIDQIDKVLYSVWLRHIAD